MKISIFLLLLFFSQELSFAANRSSYSWGKPQPVNPETVFFGEPPREKRVPEDMPDSQDKNYPWYCLEKGSERFLAKEYEKAAIFLRLPTRPGARRARMRVLS